MEPPASSRHGASRHVGSRHQPVRPRRCRSGPGIHQRDTGQTQCKEREEGAIRRHPEITACQIRCRSLPRRTHWRREDHTLGCVKHSRLHRPPGSLAAHRGRAFRPNCFCRPHQTVGGVTAASGRHLGGKQPLGLRCTNRKLPASHQQSRSAYPVGPPTTTFVFLGPIHQWARGSAP